MCLWKRPPLWRTAQVRGCKAAVVLFCGGLFLKQTNKKTKKTIEQRWRNQETSELMPCSQMRTTGGVETWAATVRRAARSRVSVRTPPPRGPRNFRQELSRNPAFWTSRIQDWPQFPAYIRHPCTRCRRWGVSTLRLPTPASRSSRRPTRSTWRRLPWRDLCPWSTGSALGSWSPVCPITAVSTSMFTVTLAESKNKYYYQIIP